MFQDDGQFYRAKVIRELCNVLCGSCDCHMTIGVAETGVTVQFIDYGNVAAVSLDEVYQLPVELMNTKTQVCNYHDSHMTVT